MMIYKDFYMSDDENLSVLVNDLNFLANTFFISFKTIELFSDIEFGKIEKFLSNNCGITHEESVRIYEVVFNLKILGERLINQGDVNE